MTGVRGEIPGLEDSKTFKNCGKTMEKTMENHHF
jgi:hypothetical protein